MKRIGITGSLASGKTTASRILAKKNGPLFSADDVVKKLYANNSFKRSIRKKEQNVLCIRENCQKATMDLG